MQLIHVACFIGQTFAHGTFNKPIFKRIALQVIGAGNGDRHFYTRFNLLKNMNG